jgi:hypothetical protein
MDATGRYEPAAAWRPDSHERFRHVPRTPVVEPVDLLNIYGETSIHRWRTGIVGAWREATISIGVLPDGGWYLDARNHSLAFANEDEAQDAAREVMADHGGDWVEVEP